LGDKEHMLRVAALSLILVLSPVVTFAAPLTVRVGESLSVSIGNKGVTVLSRQTAPPLTAFEAEGLGYSQTLVAPPGAKTVPPVGIDHTMAFPPRIPANQLQITFRKVPGQEVGKIDSFLVLENGYDHFVRYRAIMHRGESSHPTDVCDVLPGRTGFEHWP
jgi:hypothetical protein